MATLTQILTTLVADAFKAEGLDPAHGQVATSDRPDLAQFQCNGALAAAKAAKANPRAIAEKIAARLQTDPRFQKIEIAGPGFINLAHRRSLSPHRKAARRPCRRAAHETRRRSSSTTAARISPDHARRTLALAGHRRRPRAFPLPATR
jgi:arginyl-tRNA synthetase